MMVRVFHTGTGNVKSAIAYLMGKNDHTGKLRDVEPELLRGSPSLIQLAVCDITRKHKYVSGAISFRDNEHPSEAQIKMVMDSFRASFLPGLAEGENYADFWIAHRDKSNLELHFVFAGTELQTGRQLNIHPPGKRNQLHYQAFTQVMNHELGYDQITPDPLKVALSAFDAKTQVGKKSRKVKTLLAKELHGHIVRGEIANRDQLIAHLNESYGEVTRVGADYISIRLPGSKKPMRLRGPLFQENSDYQQLVKQHQQSKQPNRLTPEQAMQSKSLLETLTQERAAYFDKRYKKKETFTRSAKVAKAIAGTKSTSQKGANTGDVAIFNPIKGMTTPTQSVAPKADVATMATSHAATKFRAPATVATSTPPSSQEPSDSSSYAPVLPGVPGNVYALQMQLSGLADMLEKLTARARATTNVRYYEVLFAKIVDLQYQMSQLSLRLQIEKSNAQDAEDRYYRAKNKPKN